MPIISLQIGQLATEQKKELINKLTQAAADATNLPQNAFTILIHELPSENIGVGGIDLATMRSQQK